MEFLIICGVCALAGLVIGAAAGDSKNRKGNER